MLASAFSMPRYGTILMGCTGGVRGSARSWETRLNRTLIRPEPLKHRALTLIREVAQAA